MTESQQRKHARLMLLLSTQSLNQLSKDEQKDLTEEKSKTDFHRVNVPTSTNNVQELEIEPIRIIAQDNINDDDDVVYVQTTDTTNHHTLDINTPVIPSQPTKSNIRSSSVLQQSGLHAQNIHNTVVSKKLKLMPVYSEIKQKEREPVITKKVIKRIDASKRKPRSVKFISNEDRERIVAKYESGLELNVISDILNIPKHVVESVLHRYRKTGKATIATRCKEASLPIDVLLSVKLWMKDDCDVSLPQLVEKVWTTYNLRVSNDSILLTLTGFNYFFDRVDIIAKHTSTNTTLEQIKEYANTFKNIPQSVSKIGIVFLDFAILNITFKDSTKLSIQHKKHFIICAMNESGMLHYLTQSKTIGMHAVTEFVNDMKNKLRALSVEESIVVVGNAANQRFPKLQDAIGYYTCNAMFLPSNAPYLNPVEYLFKNLKRITSRATPKTLEALMQAIERIPSLIREADCKNWFDLMLSYVPRCMEEEIIDHFDVQG